MSSATTERTLRGAASVLLTSVAMSCHHSAPPPRSLVEDKARRDVPIAVCREPLTPVDINESGAPRAEAYWKALLPAFRAFNTTFEGVDCIGDMLSPKGKPSSATPPPIHVSSSDSTMAPVSDGTQLVWLRTFAFSDRSASGPLALVRPRPSELDVYAIGSYAGSIAHSRFELAKVGGTPVVAIRDEGCADVKVETECESTLSLALIVGGQFLMAVTTPAERLKYGSLKDVGRVKWRFTIEAPIFEPQAVRIKEKLSVRDLADNEVRKLEGERVFTLRGNALVGNAESISAEIERR